MSEYIIKVSGGKSAELPFANAKEEELIVVAFKDGKSSVCESFSVAENTLTVDCDCDCFYVILDKKASCEIGNTSTSEINANAIIEQFKADNEILKQLQTMQTRTLRGCDEIGYLPESEKRIKTFLSFDENGNPVCEVGVDEFDDAVKRAETACAFAEASEESAENAKTGAEIAKVYAEQAQYRAEEAYTNTQSIANEAIENIETAKTGAVNEIESKVEEAKGYAESAKAEAEKESKVRDEISNIVNTGKAEIQESIANAKEEIDNWSDQSSRLAQNESDIAKLFTSKANNSVLHIGGSGSSIACANNDGMPAEFTWCRTIKMNWADWEAVSANAYIDGTNLGFGASSTLGATFTKRSTNALGFIYRNASGTAVNYNLTLGETQTLFNGQTHTLCLCVSNGVFQFYIDNEKTSTSLTGSTSSIAQTYNVPTIRNIKAEYSRVYNFNFDISAENAPYTIADYQIGKSIPPSLKNVVYFGSGKNPNVVSSISSFSWNGNNYILTQGSNAATTKSIRYGLILNKGETINISFSGLTGGVMVNGAYGKFDFYKSASELVKTISVSTETLNEQYTATYNITQILFTFNCNAVSSVDERVPTILENFKIMKNGTTLALEDYTIGGKVLDVSGNKNHATITGNIAGDDDTRIEAFVETIATLTSEQN